MDSTVRTLTITISALLVSCSAAVGVENFQNEERGLIEQGNALINDDQVEEAISHFRAVIKKYPANSEAHQKLGRALSLNGDIDEAIRENSKAVMLNPNNAEAHSNLGWLLGMQKNYRGAVQETRAAIELDPEDASSYVVLGLALASLGDYDGAIAADEKAIELEPDNLKAHSNLAATLGRKGDFAGAANVYRKVLRMKPNSVAAHLGLGAALGKLGNREEQIKEFQTAVSLNPNSDSAHGKLGFALSHAGDWQGGLREGAIANWIRLSRSGPEYLQKVANWWGFVFLLFGGIFAVIFFGARFKPEPGEKVLRSFFLTLHKDHPGRFVITDRRVEFMPEAFSRWFGSEPVVIPRDRITHVKGIEGLRSGVVIQIDDGTTYDFTMPALVYKPLIAELKSIDTKVKIEISKKTITIARGKLPQLSEEQMKVFESATPTSLGEKNSDPNKTVTDEPAQPATVTPVVEMVETNDQPKDAAPETVEQPASEPKPAEPTSKSKKAKKSTKDKTAKSDPKRSKDTAAPSKSESDKPVDQGIPEEKTGEAKQEKLT